MSIPDALARRSVRRRLRRAGLLSGVAGALAPHAVDAQGAAPPAVAPMQGTLEFRFESGAAGGARGTMRLYFRDSTVRQEVRVGSDEPMMIGLFDVRRGGGVMLLPAARTLMRVPAPPATVPARTAPPTAFVAEPGVDTVGGVPCRRWRTADSTAPPLRLCLADPDAAGLPHGVLRWLGAGLGQPASAALGLALPDGATGFPLRLEGGRSGVRLEYVRFDPTPVDAARFVVPPGYTESAPPGAPAPPRPP